MSSENRFPRNLLKAMDEVRLKYFVDLTIAHPYLLTAYGDLLRAIRQPFPIPSSLPMALQGSGRPLFGEKFRSNS